MLLSHRNNPAALPSLMLTSVSTSPSSSNSLPRYINFATLSKSLPSMLIGCASVWGPLTRSTFVFSTQLLSYMFNQTVGHSMTILISFC